MLICFWHSQHRCAVKSMQLVGHFLHQGKPCQTHSSILFPIPINYLTATKYPIFFIHIYNLHGQQSVSTLHWWLMSPWWVRNRYKLFGCAILFPQKILVHTLCYWRYSVNCQLSLQKEDNIPENFEYYASCGDNFRWVINS